MPSGSSPGVAGFFAEDLIVIESYIALPAVVVHAHLGEFNGGMDEV
jgi:hypothetical protein